MWIFVPAWAEAAQKNSGMDRSTKARWDAFYGRRVFGNRVREGAQYVEVSVGLIG